MLKKRIMSCPKTDFPEPYVWPMSDEAVREGVEEHDARSRCPTLPSPSFLHLFSRSYRNELTRTGVKRGTPTNTKPLSVIIRPYKYPHHSWSVTLIVPDVHVVTQEASPSRVCRGHVKGL